MANIFERDYSQASLTPKQRIEDIARKSRVPVNVLWGIGEIAGAASDDEKMALAQRAADEFGPRIQAGEDIKALIREAAGSDEAAKAFITRSRQIADELYPEQAAKARAARAESQKGGLGTALGVGVDALQQGYGSAVEGIGRSIGSDGIAQYGADVAARNKAQIEEVAPGLTGLDQIDGIRSAAKFAGETLAQQVPQLGVSIGAGMAGAAAGGAVAGPVGAAIGGIGAGIAANLPFFYGQNRERQKEAIEAGFRTEMDEGAAALTALPQAALDTIVDRLMIGAVAGPMMKAGGGLLTRVGRGAAQGVLAETPTEIGQAMLERAQAGLPLDSDDAIREYRDVAVAAGLIGGTVGGAGGAIAGKAEPAGPVSGNVQPPPDADGAPPQAAAPLALPAPERGGTIFGEGAPGVDPTVREREAWMPRSSDVAPAQQPAQLRPQAPRGPLRAAMEAGAPVTQPQQNSIAGEGQAPAVAQPMGAAGASSPLAEQPAPMGDPVSDPVPQRTLRTAADMAPAPLLGDMPAQSQIIINVPGLPAIPATFLGSTPLGIQISDADGEISEITREEIEGGAVTIEALQPAAPQGQMSPDEAQRRLGMIEDKARAEGWSRSLLEMRDTLQQIVARQAQVDQKADAEGSTIQPADTQGIPDGLGILGAGVSSQVIAPQAEARNADQQQLGSAPELAPSASDARASLAGLAEGGDGGAEAGQAVASIDPLRRDRPEGRSAVSPDGGGVDDAAAASQPDLALKEPDQEAESEDRAKAFMAAQRASAFASGNKVASKILPGRQAKGVPMAEIEVGKHPDGGFMVRHAFNTGQRGHATPFEGQFGTPEEAEAAATGFISDRARRILAEKAEQTDETERADARKVLKWLGGDMPSAVSGKDDQSADALAANARGGQIQPVEAPIPPAVKPARKSVKRANEERMARLRSHYAPGNIVQGYGGRADRVLSFDEGKDGDWTVRVQQVEKDASGEWRPSGDVRAHRTTPTEQEFRRGVVFAAPQPEAKPVIEDIRARAAILKGVPKEMPPAVAGVSLKWDQKEGGFIFPRKHSDAVRAAVMAPEPAAQGNAEISQEADRSNEVMKTLVQADAKKPVPAQPDAKAQDFNDYIAAVLQTREWAITSPRGQHASKYQAHLSRSRFAEIKAQYESERGAAAQGGEAASQIEAAAAETAVDPTPAQAEAENYRTGKTRWNGLALSIENAKGSTRRKVTPDGKTEWEVTMPAHYGRILRTEGADGDHVDFYMGDKPESEWAYLVDQVDSDTGAFDEHKLMLGFGTREEAQKAYDAAFSDGKGPARRAAVSEMSVQQAKDWLSAGDTKKPYADLDGIKAKATETQQAADARAAKKAAKEAEDKRKALEDLRASVGRTQDLKGGTARAVVAWGDGDRFMDASGYNGHGKFVLRKGTFPEFDALVASKKPTLTGEGPQAGALRLAETAEKARDEIEWRFVRNVSGKPLSVAGRVATKSPDGKAGFRWVEIDRLVHNFAQRNGLKLTAGDDPGIMALRRENGELVGFAAALRPYMNAKGPDLDAMDAVANPPEPVSAEVAAPISAPPEPDAAAQADEPVKAKKIEDFGEKIGGARKDTAAPTGERGSRQKPADDRPAWMRRYEVRQIAKSMTPGQEGKWTIFDAKTDRHVGGYRPMLFDTEAQALEAVPSVEAARNHRVYPEGKGTETMGIYRVISDRKKALVKGGFKTREEAMRYLATNPVEIIEFKTRVDDSIHPALEQAIRIGSDRRADDAPVGAADFTEVFGFRGVEFGEWNNGAERQHLLNQAYDAFLDMAEILKIPPRAISLNGDLGLAFGARGHGLQGAKAHYERDYGVINLTKIKGAGSLAHEWWHAVDHFLGRQDGKAKSQKVQNARGDMVYAAGDRSDDYAVYGFRRQDSGVRPELRSAMQQIADAMMKRRAEFTEDSSSREKAAERAIADLDRKLADFRKHLEGKQSWGRKKDPATDAQLAKVDAAIMRIKAKDYGEMVEAPTKASGARFMFHEPVMALAEVFKDVRGRQAYGLHQGRKTGWAVELQSAAAQRDQAEQLLADAQEQRVKERTVRTEYYSHAWAMDQGAQKDYWATPHEMIARAFESYVYDRLKEVDARNDFLAYEKHNDLPAYRMFGVKPYPEGAERTAMNAAFGDLFDAIQTRETDRGVEMYSTFGDREPVATLRGDELGEWQDIRQLGRKAEAWYRENLIGSSVVNAASGMEVLFRREGAKKVSGRKGDVLLRIVPALREILAGGVVIATESDAKGNADVLAWHTIAATVMLEGAPRDVVVKVKETRDGKFHYDLSRDVSDGARHMRASGRVGTDAIGLEDNPVALNIDLAEPEINAVVPVEKMRALSDAVQREVDAAGLAGKVTPRVVRGLLGASGIPVQGRYRNGDIEVNAAAVDPVGVARHEIIHALRDPALWGASHGLFTPDEWRALVRAARADKALMGRIEAAYADRSAAVQIEEAVAEQYRQWAAARDGADALSRIFEKVRSMFRAIASALRGEGFTDAALVMERIATGEIGGRGPDGPGGGMNAQGDMEMRDALMATAAKAKGMIGRDGWRTASEWLTDAMSGFGDGKYSLLALVPGRALFTELGKKLVSAKAYLRMKEEMDAMRNGWHQTADDVAQEWLTLRGKNAAANDEMMDLMHRATLAGIDPSKPDVFDTGALAAAKREVKMRGPQAQQWAQDQVAFADRRAEGYAKLKERFDALPPEFQAMYRKVLETYSAMADDFDKAVLENIQNATRIGLKRAERDYEKALRQISDDGLTGKDRAEAMQLAKAKLDAVKKRGGFAVKARISALRKQFESNRLKGPYFPLARFGTFFVTVRDADGKVSSFSRFESEKQQMAHVRAMEEQNPGRVQHGTMDDSASLKSQVDPTFVADVERILAESGADFQVMDAVWQRWLETLPDQSIRTAKIHRKGREGWNRDAFRAFSKHMFHGAHQLARLKYAIQMEDMIEEARLEARRSDDPNRLGLIVNEMDKRHKFTLEPTGSAAVASMSSLAFVWYLGATPAAALANISQTTVVGVPVMAARFKGASVADVLKQLGRASADFGKGRGQKLTDAWSAANSEALSADERAAMAEAYRRGTVDRTQAHDLASVAETGIEYNAARERVMKAVGWFFHHAERFNREVTFLAGYRLARAEGLSHESAVDAAADVTWKTHYDYQNCVDGETEILTLHGWKRYDQLRPGERIISTDAQGQAVEIGVQEVNIFHRPQDIALFSGSGPRKFSMAVTNDHKCVVMKERKTGGKRGWTAPYFEMAKDLDQRHHILRAPLAPLSRPDSVGVDMAALIGWFVAEGWYARNRGATVANATRIEQSQVHNPQHVAEIDALLGRLGGRFSRHETKGGRHIHWSITGDLNRALRAAAPDKLLTWEMFATMSAAEMAALLDAFAKADGTLRGNNGCLTISQKASTNRQNLDVLQAMATAIGRTASIGEGGTRDCDHLILAGHGQIKTQKTAVEKLLRSELRVPLVWCPTTDNGRWIARRMGVVFVTGNTARPRFMQNDMGKILTQFRQFTVNTLWRLFRDAHQTFKGESPEVRAEAKTQLIGITLSMMAHAGIRGTWGYGLAMLLLGALVPGAEDDDIEAWLQDALLMEGDTLGVAAWNFGMGAALNGAPGQVLGVDLRERIGMPNLWFRGPSRDLEGEDLYMHYVGELLGPTFGIGAGLFRGFEYAADGEIYRGVETAVPKVIRDAMKAGRYGVEGVVTKNGDDILPDVNPWQILMQASGFTPAQIAERYDINSRLKNQEIRITERRQRLHKQATSAIRDGKAIPESVVEGIRAFNGQYPEYPITPDSIRQSLQSRLRASARNEFGVALNPKLNDRLRAAQPPQIYN